MLSRGVVMVLCGLPGSGKSHLSNSLQQRINSGLLQLSTSTDAANISYNLQCAIVDYDHLMPPDVERQLLANPKRQNTSEWKAYRNDIYKAVDEFISRHLSGQTTDCHETDASPRISELLGRITQQNSDVLLTEENSKYVFVIDDNMYLESMRHPYFQLARKYNFGFCQVHLQCDWHRWRNQSREFKVNERTMELMAEKFEAPSSKLKSEEFICTITNNDDHYESCWVDLECLLRKSFDNPVEEKEDDSLIREMSRQICLKNVVHTADQMLRILISETMTGLIGNLDKPQLKAKGKELNCARQEILEDIRKGAITVSESITNEIEMGNSALVQLTFKEFLKTCMENKVQLTI